jgi:hypothetical protein
MWCRTLRGGTRNAPLVVPMAADALYNRSVALGSGTSGQVPRRCATLKTGPREGRTPAGRWRASALRARGVPRRLGRASAVSRASTGRVDRTSATIPPSVRSIAWRVDSTDRVLTTNQGVSIADNQNSLKAGLRGPTLLEDFILREKITHFDHKRIPERIVHASPIEVDVSLEAAPAVLYEALVLPDGDDAVAALRADGRTLEFIKEQYRHCKPILALGGGEQLLRTCGIDVALPDGEEDPGLIIASDANAVHDDFIAAIATHRHFARETDPPRV